MYLSFAHPALDDGVYILIVQYYGTDSDERTLPSPCSEQRANRTRNSVTEKKRSGRAKFNEWRRHRANKNRNGTAETKGVIMDISRAVTGKEPDKC